MNHVTAVSPSIAPRSRTWLRNAGLAVSGSILVAVAAHISVPLFFTPVPFTLQTLAVLGLGLLLGPSVAFSAMMLYLLEGVSGLPVFSPAGPGGIAQLLGPTGGYLISYPFAAAAAGWLYRHARFVSNFGLAIASAAIGDILILAAGAAWLATLTHLTPAKIAALAVVPFLPGDALKVIAAAAIVTGIARVRKQLSAEQ